LKNNKLTNIKDVINACKKNPLIKCHVGASDEDLRHAMTVLKVKFPQSFVKYVRECGWLDIAGEVVLGLGPRIPKSKSSFRVSQRECLDGVPPLRPKLIVVYEVGNGDLECMDCNKVKDGECPVVLWEHDHPEPELQKPRILNRTFTRWLADKVFSAPEIT